jgi:hypothetical protein
MLNGPPEPEPEPEPDPEPEPEPDPEPEPEPEPDPEPDVFKPLQEVITSAISATHVRIESFVAGFIGDYLLLSCFSACSDPGVDEIALP